MTAKTLSSQLPAALANLQTATPPASTLASAAFRSEANFERAFAAHFQGFQTLRDKRLVAMLDAAKKFCRAMSYDEPPHWLVLLGTSGAGKTMLAKLCVSFMRKYLDYLPDPKNREGERFLRNGGTILWFECVDKMVANHDYGWLPAARDRYLLNIDDIGVEYERQRALATSKLYDILTHRETRFTIITANLTVEAIGKLIDARIASRLLRNGATVVDVAVPDFNLPNHGR